MKIHAKPSIISGFADLVPTGKLMPRSLSGARQLFAMNFQRLRIAALTALTILSLLFNSLLIGTASAADISKSAPLNGPTVFVTLMAGESLDEQGQTAPLRPETVRLLNFFERKLNIRFQIQRYPLARINELLKQPGQLAFGMSKTTERQAYMQFSEVIFTGYVWIVTREDRQFEFNSIQDLAGKSVGIVRGMRLSDEVDRERNQLFRVEDDPSQLGARLRKLNSGRMDCMLINSRHTNPRELENELNALLSDSNPDPGQTDPKQRVKVLNRALLTDPIHFATNKRQPSPWLEKINNVLRAAQNSGELAALLRS